MKDECSPTPGVTIKLRAPPHVSEHAIYFTIAGNMLFVNSKEMESIQWITALFTSYSRRLNDGVAVKEIVKDMKEAFDPSGSYEIPGSGGVEVNGIIHHLGLVLEKYYGG